MTYFLGTLCLFLAVAFIGMTIGRNYHRERATDFAKQCVAQDAVLASNNKVIETQSKLISQYQEEVRLLNEKIQLQAKDIESLKWLDRHSDLSH